MQKFQIIQHFGSKRHINNASQREAGLSKTTTPITNSLTPESQYANYIPEMFTSANIPLNQLNNPTVSRFLAKWTKTNTFGIINLSPVCD